MNKTMKSIVATLAVGTMVACSSGAQQEKTMETTLTLTKEWDKIFPLSDQVDHRKVTFKNRYGVTLAADLYTPRGAEGKLPAVVVSGPFGAVKEQSSGLYAQELAKHGFVTLAFDPSFTGESGGEPRDVASPDINTEDFSAGVDFVGLLDQVDRERIGILGICGWGGMALNAAAIDTRIKAVATSVMYDMTRVMARGYNDSNTPEMRQAMKKELNAQRWIDAEAGQPAHAGKAESLPSPDQLTEQTPQFVADYSNFYKSKRGFHKRSINSNGGWTKTNALSFMNMPLLSYASEITIPALIIAGEQAHSRYFSEDAYKAIGSMEKELLIVPDARHTDLYDNQTGKIPFERLESFFREHLK